VKRVPQARHPAAVLLYLRAGSALPAAAKKMDLEATLRQAGHRVVTVSHAERLRGRLAAESYDFVLTDLPDAAQVAREAGSLPETPEIVPVASEADRDALRASREEYPVVIEAGRSRSYLSALDEAMRRRAER